MPKTSKSVGHDNQGGSGEVIPHVAKDKGFRGGVKAGSGFVQDQDMRLLQECSCNCQALALAS